MKNNEIKLIAFLLILGFVGCSKKHRVNFIIQNCEINNCATADNRCYIVYGNAKLYREKGAAQSGDGTFVTHLNKGENVLELEEGHYSVLSDRIMYTSSGEVFSSSSKWRCLFEINGMNSEYDFCKKYSDEWSPEIAVNDDFN